MRSYDHAGSDDHAGSGDANGRDMHGRHADHAGEDDSGRRDRCSGAQAAARPARPTMAAAAGALRGKMPIVLARRRLRW